MGGFDIAILISLVYVFIGIRVVREIWKNRTTVFDDNLTPQDRYAISQVAFFVFIPISVALHELGHAIAIWSFGGKVINHFGFYFFAGFVGYDEPSFTPLQELVVTAAGTIVNILIFVVIFAVVLLKRPPFRPAYNELLITFAVLQAANALIFYPMIDFATGMEGDWSQMYSSDNGNWRWVVLAIHASLLIGAFWFSRQKWFRLKLGALTGLPPGGERGLMGGAMDAISGAGRKSTRTGTATQAERKPLTLTEERMVEAANRVSSGWAGSVQHQLRSTPSSSEVLMVWSDGVNGAVRAAALRALPDGSGELWGLIFANHSPGAPAERRPLKRWEAMPDADELTLALRIGMEEIGRWKIPNATKPADV